MANAVLIIGRSGTGKSRSVVNLDPKETAIINVIGKPLPFRGWKTKYVALDSKKGTGNLLQTDNWDAIRQAVIYIDRHRKDIKNLIIDDFQYIMANEFMRRSSETGYTKFSEMGDHVWEILWAAINLGRPDLTVIVLAHSETDDTGKTKMKTIGKMLDEKICLEGLFVTCLNTVVVDGQYYFETQNNGMNTTKSPEGMFTGTRIPNDLQLVITAIKNYEKSDTQKGESK